MSDFNINDMNKLMILSNRLSETHILNLKTYPKIFFDGVVTAEVKYDFTPPEHGKKADFPAGLVGYKILVKEMPEDVEKRAAFLERAVKNLFWNDTYVTVSVTESVVP